MDFINKKKLDTPGDIYSSISVESRDFSSGDSEFKKKKNNKYVEFCKTVASKFPSLKKGSQKTNYKIQNAIEFLNWDLSYEEYNAALKIVLFSSLFFSFLLVYLSFFFLLEILINLFGNEILPILIVLGVPIALFFIIYNSFKNYPIKKVKEEKVQALTFIPEILGYLVMSLKLVPNLEKAIEFAATHGHGKIAKDLKLLLWEVKVGIKNSMAEGIDDLAYKWGDISTELKKALMKIRASVIEPSEAKRYQLLDNTMEETLSSIKEKLEDYARGLNQPSMVLFYLGVLLPLLLIIVLPVGSAFSGSALAKPIYLVLIYNIAIPLGSFLFAKNIIQTRPATYIPPKIPDSHPELPPKNHFRIFKNFTFNIYIAAVIIIGLLLFGTIFLQSMYGTTKRNALEDAGYIMPEEPLENAEFDCTPSEQQKLEQNPDYVCQAEINFWENNSTTPYILIFGIMLTFAFGLSFILYFQSIYKYKIQKNTEKMEDEFKDALYLISSRLGENKPIENALVHTRDFLPKSLIGKRIFGKTIDNINILGLTLNNALFDKTYGALKNNPSNIINSAMRLMVDSVKLGVSVAAKTLMSYSMQLRNSDDVTKMLKTLVSSITSTLSSMAKFIAPIVLGITTALQKIVISTLRSVADSGFMQDMGEGIQTASSSLGGSVNTSSISGMGGSISVEAVNQLASSTGFLIIVAIYVIQITIILIAFTSMIEEKNIVLAKLRIAKTLPVSIILFIITTIGANLMF